MERRVLLAVVLSFVVLFGYQALFVKPNVKPPVPAATTSTAPAATAPVEAPSAPPVPTGPMPAVLAGESAERRIVIETSRVKATFSNHGAVLESWLLKDYLDSNGRPMDMVAPALTVPERHPLSLTVGDAALSARLNTALYQASSGDQKVDTRTGIAAVHVSRRVGRLGGEDDRRAAGRPAVPAAGQDGSPRRRPAAARHRARRRRASATSSAACKSTSWLVPATYQPPQAIVQRVDTSDAIRIPAATLPTQPVQEGADRYGGVDDQYFLAAALPGGKHARVDLRSR